MNTFRVARAAVRARPAALRAVVQRRTYAEAVPDKIKLSMSLPHQSIYKSQDVVQVNIPAESGEMGVLANHVPSIEQLKPGIVEVVEESGSAKQWFLAGGFATVQPNSTLSINSPEGYPIEDFSADAIRAGIAEAQKVANGGGSEQDIAEAKIELEVLETLSAHLLMVIATGQQSSQKHSALDMDDDGKVGWGRRVDARFATPASRNILGQGTTTLPLEHTFIGRALAKGSCLESIQGSSREQSVGSGRDVFSEVMLDHVPPSPAGDRDLKDKSTAQFVEENQEDPTLCPLGLTVKRDRRSRNSQDKGTQLCHSCGEALPYEQHCGICGHDYCYKCASERLKKRDAATWTDDNSRQAPGSTKSIQDPDTKTEEGAASTSPTTTAKAIPKTPTRGPVTGNPFFLADRYANGTMSAPNKAKTESFASRPRRLSDCVSRRFLDKTPPNVAIHKRENRQEPKQEDTLQDIERHSLCCTAHMRPVTTGRYRADKGWKDDTLQNKIGKLCRHAEEFHKSQNMLGHTDTGFGYRARSRDSMTHTSVTTAAEETPTRLPRSSRLPSQVSDDAKTVNDGERKLVTEPGRILQDVAAAYGKVKEVGFSHLPYLAPLDCRGPKSRPLSGTSSSSSIQATERPADTEEPPNQESALRPQPLTLRPKNADVVVDSGGSKGSPGKNALDTDLLPGTSPHEALHERSVDGLPVAMSAGNDLPSLTGYRRHRQDTYLCSKPQTPHPTPEPWPLLRKVEAPRQDEQPLSQPVVPWSRQALRRVSDSVGCLHRPGEKIDSPISPRNKGEGRRGCEGTPHCAPSKIIPETTPISDWRRKLVKPAENAANPPQMNVVCESCDLTEPRRLALLIDTPEACSRRSNSFERSVEGNNSNLEDPFSEPRLSIRAIENSLAWKKVQGDLGKDHIIGGEAKKVPSSPRPSAATPASNKSAGETAATARCSQLCSWRSRYLRLRDEILMSEDLLAVCERGREWRENEAPSRYEGNVADELGIEALTVVVHMRDRDNLVINTDLTGRQKQEE
ncbi:hypothetical protein E4U43_004865 [Claviceps pusilla]|uniref:ATP synthase subunit delta, mitochondrial n=1 Tax=Claviceps pusilla TaxID=123648 RepID=A0A9P7NH98_9HYPO|nr:hypothetical protein E4U43_004865 [Claviceps pusilla]